MEIKLKFYWTDKDIADPYTIVIDQEVFTMSENALSPRGVNMYAGYIKEFNIKDFGKQVDFNKLPYQVQKATAKRVYDFLIGE